MVGANNPFLYYRTDSNTKTLVPNPANLPANQIVEFEGIGEDVAESFKRRHKNRLAITTIPQPDGTMKVDVEHMGMDFERIEIKGYLRNKADQAAKLRAFANAAQRQGVHAEGRFGLKVPNNSAYDYDPTETYGLVFEDFDDELNNNTASIFEFTAVMVVGGVQTIALP